MKETAGSTSDSRPSETSQHLSAWDVASLLIGIVVGVSIFKTPPMVFSNVESSAMGLLAWGLGAVVSLCGALCFCELATTYPGFGGEYQYLSKAYGRWVGFLFAWLQITVILTGSIGAMAFVFADYSLACLDDLQRLFLTAEEVKITHLKGENWLAVIASFAILLSAAIHASGIGIGKGVQNFLTVSKAVALGTILIVGLTVVPAVASELVVQQDFNGSFGVALVFVMYAYGGWNDVAMVTPEVKNQQRSMPRALLMGLLFVAVLYLGLNFVFVKVLGLTGVRATAIPAAEVVRLALGREASLIINLIVICSALGAIHGTTFASCRLVAAVGEDYPAFKKLSHWTSRGVPLIALGSITFVTLLLVLGVGTAWGRTILEQFLVSLFLPRPDWQKYFGGFDTLVAATAPLFWVFFAMSGISVLLLRLTDRSTPRSFLVPFFPLPVLIFCGASCFMLWKSIEYAWELTLISLPLIIVGLLLALITQFSGTE